MRSLHIVPVVLALLGALAVPGDAATAVGTRQYANPRFAISFEFPSDWAPEAEGSHAISFAPRGPRGCQAEVRVRFDGRGKGRTLEGEVIEFTRALAGRPGAQLIAQEQVTVAGKRGVRLRSRFIRREETVRQEQYIVEHGIWFYWIGYTASSQVFGDHLPAFRMMLGTLRLGD
ncbi:MAG: hypothetical protein HY660_01995 [Armatimonadetes bacterium]|nr:hypothetical protein [Armatimonadota bacterium]